MDNAFKAKYLVVSKVYGEFAFDTIEFVVYDHYGVPEFAHYENVLLYLSSDSGTYFHQKYMFNDVYLTKNGRWAGPYPEEDYKHPNNKKTKIRPIKITFDQEISYPIKNVDSGGNIITRNYPKPFFRTIDNKAIPVYGNYVVTLYPFSDIAKVKISGSFYTFQRLGLASDHSENCVV